jgi:hemerythrin-like domain-containing protein
MTEARATTPPSQEPTPSASDGAAAYLEWDHRRLDAIFSDAMRNVRDGQWREARSVFGLFDKGLRRHIDVEEQLLFPLFEVRTGLTEHGPTFVMRQEHREILGWLSQIGAALEGEDPERAQRGAAAVLEVLGAHNRKEEGILYPMCDAAMSDGEREALVARMQAA